jgi:hypothetical protein
MRFTFRASLHAGLAADAAGRIDVKLVSVHQAVLLAADVAAPEDEAHSGGATDFLIWQADTLNSGILLRGSSVRCVNRFALRPPGQ